MFKCLLLLLFFSTALASSLPPALNTIKPDTQLPNSPYILIASRGGNVEQAFYLATLLQDKICIVLYADSAALQIILPACKERYYVPHANFGFHTAGRMINERHYSPWAAQAYYESIMKVNKRMADHMIKSGLSYTEETLLNHMKNDTIIKDMSFFKGWIKPVEQCEECPFYTKLLINTRIFHETNL